MSEYAARTEVSSLKSKAEVETLLDQFGASSIATMIDKEHGRAHIAFRVGIRQYRLTLPLPDPAQRRFTHDARGKLRQPARAKEEWEQACRSRWRALVLVVKAKLEAVRAGISTIEREFLAETILPDGRTVAQLMTSQVDEAYRSGAMPSGLLPMEGGRQ